MRTFTARWAVSIVVVVAATLGLAPAAPATVLASGRVTTDFAGGSDIAQAVAIQPDGKIVVAGGGNNLFKLARYNANGSLDTTFGQGGRVTTSVGGGTRPNASALSLVLRPDGRIVAGGYHRCCLSMVLRAEFVVVQYNANGSLDTTFGGGDGIITPVSAWEVGAAAQDLLLLDDGRIVAAGYTSGYTLARFTADGSPDTTFDGDGVTFAGPGEGSAAFALVQQPGGRVVAVGFSGSSNGNFALARYDQNGALDTTFGSGGTVATDFAGAPDHAKAALLQSDGRIVAGGLATRNGATDFALARYNANGALDTTFGQSGKVTTDFATSQDDGNGAILQPDGRIVLAGSTGNDFALARYNPNGALDTTFGQSGKVVTDFSGTLDQGFAVARQADGKLVVIGSSLNTSTDFALARYNPNGTLDTTFGS